uniref:Uncharacterized protein n=1 Tax=Musca domestica TaxID=7370 RepID=A0A1I8MCH4_MUSDO
MATANAMSSSCQSIAAVTNMSTSVGGCLRSNNGNGNTTQYVMGTGSLGRLKLKTLGASDEELDFAQLSQSTHILGRVKSERFLSSKVDEDRRRRTIIVEKKNDSFGFTLQSYGIHYKKDQEVEMITYVDYVEYDGPAYKAGMREGDVILSINGQNMEKADHKTLVDFIKSCDSRMRMVVLFEDCVRKVNLHMRYIQLQNLLQNKMNELERICVRERELLEGKWKTHSLPARKKATTATEGGTETGNSPTDTEINLPYYRPALSTEDFTNIARQSSQQTIIPPPAQYMLSYQYFDPTYRYVLKPSISTTSSGDCFVTIGEPLSRAQSGDTTTAGPTSQHFTSQRRASVSQTPPAPPPRTCEKHKPPNKQQQQQQQSIPPKQEGCSAQKSTKAGKHCHGRSCNPCIDFRWKSSAKTAALAASGNGGGGGDNVSLDAYDLASPCCDTQCVPSRRHVRHHHKEHSHKHKHRDRERESESKERPPRPKSQSHVSPGPATRHHHHRHIGHEPGHHHTAAQHYQYYGTGQQQQQQQQQQSISSQHQKSGHGCDSHSGSIRSRYFDLASGLASHCSLHSCTSSEFQQPDTASYTTSISTDTLFYDPNSENPGMASRQHSTKSRQSTCQQQHQQQQQQQHQHQHHHHQQQQGEPQGAQYMHHMYQQRYHITATQIQPAQIFPNTAYVHKPKSWDNLTAANLGAYGYGYGYLDTVAMKPIVNLQIAQQRHSIPRKNPYGRYSAYTDVENYAPPPTEFLEQVTTTTTTITAKSAEDILASPGTGPPSANPCECANSQQHQQAIKMAQMQINQSHAAAAGHHNQCQMGYYSHLPQPKTDAATSTAGSPQTAANAATVTEVTRL